MRQYWEENLGELNRHGLTNRLREISNNFNQLPLKEKYNDHQLYFIAQFDFNAIKVGISKSPQKRYSSIQSSNSIRLLMLYYYDPVPLLKEFPNLYYFKKNKPIHPESALEEESLLRNWLMGKNHNKLHGEWFYPDSRALRILIKEGLILLEEIK